MHTCKRFGNCRVGTTLVEMSVGILLVVVLVGVTYEVFRYVAGVRNRGTVDLQELQGARFAINYLRRDFRCAVPFVPQSATPAQKARAASMPIMNAETFVAGGGIVPVLVSPNELHFFKQTYTTPDFSATPVLEEINYSIDTTRKCLVRTTAGHEITFPDIRSAKFELYGHSLDAEVPMLLVTLTVVSGAKQNPNPNDGLTVMTTLSSAVINQNLHGTNWNQVYY